jgi:transposase
VLKAIPSMEVTDAYQSDAVQMGGLLESLHIDDIEAVAADSAYLSRRNCDIVEALGAKPFINLKCNVKGKSHGSFAWRKMVYDYRRSPEEWKRVYHFRSSAESAFSALKRKFGYRLSAIRKDLQRKELMIKVIVYNLNILARITI